MDRWALVFKTKAHCVPCPNYRDAPGVRFPLLILMSAIIQNGQLS
jgi:hypothetical protein